MNVLVNFRCLTKNRIEKRMFEEIVDSDEISSLIDDFKKYVDEIRFFNNDTLEGYFLRSDNSIDSYKVFSTKDEIEKICNMRIDEYNERIEKDFYLFLDEICTVFVENGKAMPMEDEDDYANPDDVKRAVKQAMYRIAESTEDFNLSTYCSVFYLVYIDIIEKNVPMMIW